MNEVFVPEVCVYPAQIELANTQKRSQDFSALFHFVPFIVLD